jgi:succinate dehydrogenase/fumarate reductase flavoprotein subunit
MIHVSTDVLIIGAGGAGMYAAIAAARAGARVLLLDKSVVGRGGATVMAQMTVAAAIGHQEPDDWTIQRWKRAEVPRMAVFIWIFGTFRRSSFGRRLDL